MLTNLLAIFVVILLAPPATASASDIPVISEQAGSSETELSKTVTDGRFRESEPSKAVPKSEPQAANSERDAEQQSPRRKGKASSGAALPTSQDDGPRVLTARLKGSLCVSCLYQLERKVQELGGVKSARVIRPPKTAANEDNGRAFAQVQIIYTSSKLNPKKIRQFIHNNDFGIKDENDVALTADFKPLIDPFENERASKVINAQYK